MTPFQTEDAPVEGQEVYHHVQDHHILVPFDPTIPIMLLQKDLGKVDHRRNTLMPQHPLSAKITIMVFLIT